MQIGVAGVPSSSDAEKWNAQSATSVADVAVTTSPGRTISGGSIRDRVEKSCALVRVYAGTPLTSIVTDPNCAEVAARSAYADPGGTTTLDDVAPGAMGIITVTDRSKVRSLIVAAVTSGGDPVRVAAKAQRADKATIPKTARSDPRRILTARLMPRPRPPSRGAFRAGAYTPAPRPARFPKKNPPRRAAISAPIAKGIRPTSRRASIGACIDADA